MKTSTTIGSIAGLVGEERAIVLVAEAGFDAFDFSASPAYRYDWATGREMTDNPHPLASREYLSFVRRLGAVAKEYGIRCNQSHAPFPTDAPNIRDRVLRALECTAMLGGEICVVHPMNNASAEANREMYESLLPYAKEYGVKIALENMYNWNENGACPAACSSPADFLRHLSLLPKEHFCACLDIGHAEMRGVNTSAVEKIRALGDNLKALHIHDVDGVNDNHALPFTLAVDFPPIVNALREINYEGYFTLEVLGEHTNRFTTATIGEGVKELYRSARRLADMFEGKK